MSQDNTSSSLKIAILGCGNIGLAIAKGLVLARVCQPQNVYLTRKTPESLKKLLHHELKPSSTSPSQMEDKNSEEELDFSKFNISTDNIKAVQECKIIFLAVTPQTLNELLESIKGSLKPSHHILISVVSGAEIKDIAKRIGTEDVEVVRAMPNTAIAFRESMTCISAKSRTSDGLQTAKKLFDVLGETLVVDEEQMVPATALCACGVAFFCRAIRAASQGGIEIGFHSEDAIKLAAQTAKGAATLLLQSGSHPEREVDKVTTPQGCTIAGLNQMEHNGFSSAFIKGIVTSAEKAAVLYKAKQQAQQSNQ